MGTGEKRKRKNEDKKKQKKRENSTLKKNTGCGGLLARPGTCTRRTAALDFSTGVVYQHHHPIIGRDVELER